MNVSTGQRRHLEAPYLLTVTAGNLGRCTTHWPWTKV